MSDFAPIMQVEAENAFKLKDGKITYRRQRRSFTANCPRCTKHKFDVDPNDAGVALMICRVCEYALTKDTVVEIKAYLGLKVEQTDWAYDVTGQSPGRSDALILPDAFWTARPWLSYVRQLAWSRLLLPESLLASTLAVSGNYLSHYWALPPVVIGHQPIGLSFGLLGRSGGGKTGSVKPAEDMFRELANHLDGDLRGIVGRRNKKLVDPTPQGAHARFFRKKKGSVSEDDEDTWDQILDNLLLVMTEGQKLVDALRGKSGPYSPALFLRAAWSGEELGFDIKGDPLPHVPALSYVYSAIYGLQREPVQDLLRAGINGDVQRLIFMPTTGSRVPDDVEPPGGLLPVHLPPASNADLYSGAKLQLIRIPDAVRREVRAARQEILGSAITDEGAEVGHEVNNQLRLAARFALFDDRDEVNAEDWQLASEIMILHRRIIRHLVTHELERRNDEDLREMMAKERLRREAAMALYREDRQYFVQRLLNLMTVERTTLLQADGTFTAETSWYLPKITKARRDAWTDEMRNDLANLGCVKLYKKKGSSGEDVDWMMLDASGLEAQI
jgi:hypothetical protein